MNVTQTLCIDAQYRTTDQEYLITGSADSAVELLHEETEVLVQPQVHVFVLSTCDVVGTGRRTECVEFEHQYIRRSVQSQFLGFLYLQRQFDDQRVGFGCLQQYIRYVITKSFLALLRRRVSVGGDVHAWRPLMCCQFGDTSVLVLFICRRRQTFAVRRGSYPLLRRSIYPAAGVSRVSGQQHAGLRVNTDSINFRIRVTQAHLVRHGLREQRFSG